ncbi:signal transduction protein, partial [Desulfobacter hydrogenophilus]
KILFRQGMSKLKKIYILKDGTADRFHEDIYKKLVTVALHKGEVFGGISILLNESVAIRSLEIQKNTSFYTLPKNVFISLCDEYEDFKYHFTNTFGKRMLDKTYSSLIVQKRSDKDESLQFFSNSISSVIKRNVLFCGANNSIKDAAILMKQHRCSSILIKQDGRFIGITTDQDFRNKVVAADLKISTPISDIMSYPLISIPEHSSVFEAFIKIMKTGIKHLAVINNENDAIGVISNSDLINAQGKLPFLFIKEINKAESYEEISKKQKQLPKSIYTLINEGAKAQNINNFVTAITDAILEKLIKFAIEEIGQPPVKFAFMVMGSEGRKEQTLKTDQDNAIIFEDVNEQKLESVNAYFLKLGEHVCNMLDKTGYDFCKGNIMAKNPEWCQPVSIWKKYFKEWIYNASPETLLQTSIFFDFRFGYGDISLVNELRASLFDFLGDRKVFFRYMAENTSHFRVPIGFFGNFIVESKGNFKNTFDIKRPMMLVVDFARIYALQHKISATNTMERLELLYKKNVISESDYNDISHSYSYMMNLRFINQIHGIINEGKDPNNNINPKKLSRIEQQTLKEIFKKIEKRVNLQQEFLVVM